MSKISKKSAPILVGVVLLLIALTLLVPILYEFPHHPLDWTLGKIIVIVIGVIAFSNRDGHPSNGKGAALT
jgi:hypothetical protein